MIDDEIKVVYAMYIPLVFPEGFAIGGQKGSSNFSEIERNGENQPVIRGTTLAGLLRSAAEDEPAFDEVLEDYFGYPLDSGLGRGESRLIFSDSAVINYSTNISTHNLINRHTSSTLTLGKGLFSLERVSAGAQADVFIRLNSDGRNEEKDRELLNFLAGQLNGGIFIGGSSNRGVGRCLVRGNQIGLARFDMRDADSVANYLDMLYFDQKTSDFFKPISIPESSQKFQIKVTLQIPKGQDLLCGAGSAEFPVSVFSADGKEYWKIPGSSLRGVFRNWMSRLAARDGERLSDNVEQYITDGERDVLTLHKNNDAILDLFGSLNQRGRIHFCDAISSRPVERKDEQKRFHVVIDRFTGGTNDGKLFSNTVLVSSDNLKFETEISIDKPEQKEVIWLQKALQALHLGLIRLGSSKASGRLEVSSINILANPKNLIFETIKKDF